MPDPVSSAPEPDSPPCRVEILVQSPGWGPVEPLAKKCFDIVSAYEMEAIWRGETTILFADDDTVQTLNRDYRHKDKSTNVLSFPAEKMPGLPEDLQSMGEVILARETCEAEASATGRPLESHVSHLIVHGLLHLAGYDHVEDTEANIMEALETKILAQLGIPDPYAPSTGETV